MERLESLIREHSEIAAAFGVKAVHGKPAEVATAYIASELSRDQVLLVTKTLIKVLTEAREFIASDENCGPCGLGLIVTIDDALELATKERKGATNDKPQ